MEKVDEWLKTCLKKKKLSEGYADNIIVKAKKDNVILYKYYCPHCFHWHVTRQPNNN